MNTIETKRSLESKLDKLTVRVAKIEMDLRAAGSKDLGEQAIEVENQEVLERLSKSERRELKAIQTALARIEKGTYRMCANCGGEITTTRLEALPDTSICVSCAL